MPKYSVTRGQTDQIVDYLGRLIEIVGICTEMETTS